MSSSYSRFLGLLPAEAFVPEMVVAYKKASGKKIPLKVCPRRPGDATKKTVKVLYLHRDSNPLSHCNNWLRVPRTRLLTLLHFLDYRGSNFKKWDMKSLSTKAWK